MANVGMRSNGSLSDECGRLFLNALPMDEWVLLDQGFASRLRGLLVHLWIRGFGLVRVSCGRRTLAEQKRLYGLGRTARQCKAVGVDELLAHPTSPQVTWILPYDSKHVDGHAADLYLADYGDRIYESLRTGCRLMGLTWGGSWKVGDYGHVESK